MFDIFTILIDYGVVMTEWWADERGRTTVLQAQELHAGPLEQVDH